MADTKISSKAGRDHGLDVKYKDGTKITSWYIGLINSSGFTAISADNTMASHAGWTELNAQYDEAARVEWPPGAVSNQEVVNATGRVFTFNTSIGVKGYFITSDSTKGGSSGTIDDLYEYESTKNFNDDDTLTITHTHKMTDDNS